MTADGGERRDVGARAARPDPLEPIAPAGTHAVCDICGGPLLDLHCKLVCKRCGFQRDCSDP